MVIETNKFHFVPLHFTSLHLKLPIHRLSLQLAGPSTSRERKGSDGRERHPARHRHGAGADSTAGPRSCRSYETGRRRVWPPERLHGDPARRAGDGDAPQLHETVRPTQRLRWRLLRRHGHLLRPVRQDAVAGDVERPTNRAVGLQRRRRERLRREPPDPGLRAELSGER